ncbi:MAG: class I SAM-dependent methyltransferase [Chloroflexi bacterium]|nr:class I SAM-dependent methyltransferase [Chloroflexota bacterium]
MHDPLQDAASRRTKAQKILAVFDKVASTPLLASVCVDVGSAYGLITKELAKAFRLTIGVEYSNDVFKQSCGLNNDLLLLVQADGRALPLPDDSVQYAVCAQVYEHVPQHERMMQEIWRVLVPGGICFFSGPNRLFPYEFHWKLPFIHWLPLPVARRLAERIRRKEMDSLYLHSYTSLRRLVRQFQVHDYTAQMIKDPESYALGGTLARWRWMRSLPLWLLAGLVLVAPNFNWVLVKPVETRG